MNFRKLITYLTMGTAAAMPLAVAQNPTILQGSYISNVFGNSNFIKNPNAQTNIADVTVSNATVTRSTTTPLVATSEFLVTTSTSTGSATWSTRTFDSGMKGQNCEARFSYRGFSVGSTTAQILQGANVVAQLTLTPSTDPRIASINFPCGDLSSATTFRLQQATASLTGTNEIGGIYVGLATNMANVAQAENVFKANNTDGASVPNAVTTQVAFPNVVFNSSGTYNSSTGLYTVTKPGRYLVHGRVAFGFVPGLPASTDNYIFVRKNGSPVGNSFWSNPNISMYLSMSVTTVHDFAVGDTIDIAVLQSTGAARTLFSSTGVNLGYSEFSISRFPSSSELVVTPERQNVFGGVVYTAESQSLFVGSAEPTAYSSYNNSTWNKPAKLVGKAQVTTTNSGNDLGFSIPNMPVGAYKLQITGLLNAEPTSVTGVFAACNYKIVETTTSTDVAKQAYEGLQTASGGTRNFVNSFQGIFNNTSVATRNFRLEAKKYTDTDASNNSGCQAYSNTSASSIESNIAFTIIPLDQPSNSALYVQGPVKAAETGAAIPASYVGYVQEATRGSDVSLSTTAGTFTDITGLSISLDPGVWEIEAQGQLYVSGAAGVSPNGRIGSWQITDNAGTPNVQREALCGFTNGVVGTSMTTCRINLRLLVTTTTIYKVRAATVENSTATTNPTVVQLNASSNRLAYIRAVRVN